MFDFSLFGALMPLPRLLYAMSADGMSFEFFSKVTARRSSPIYATVPSAVIVGKLLIFILFRCIL